MADLENKIKEVAENAADIAKTAVGGVTEEAKAFASDKKAYAAEAVENVKTEGKEVVEEIKAAVTGQKLNSAEGEAGYRSKGSAPSAIEISAVALGALAILLRHIIGIVAGAVAVILGAKARKQNQTTLATIGFVLGALGCILSLLSILF